MNQHSESEVDAAMRRTVDFVDGKLVIIDQTRLPEELVTLELCTPVQAADAITTMKVRGAPAIGVAAAIGVVLGAAESSAPDSESLLQDITRAAQMLKNTRPTAYNLFWGIDRMVNKATVLESRGFDPEQIVFELKALAVEMIEEDERVNRKLGANGAELLPDPCNVLTHCNAGALACVSYGTALGVIRAAVEAGKTINVYADETRPRLQGMKLTCYELAQDNINVTVITDNMAGWLMRNGMIDCVVVGADRIAANGDVANKIGTYSVAVLANHHAVPFFVAAPTSTIDFAIESGEDITIEERTHEEVTHIMGKRIAPDCVKTINPSFDVTPADLVTAIITEAGVARPPFRDSLKRHRAAARMAET